MHKNVNIYPYIKNKDIYFLNELHFGSYNLRRLNPRFGTNRNITRLEIKINVFDFIYI